MNNLKIWPHLTIVAVVVAVLAGVGVALWMRGDRATAEAVPNAARIQRIEGDVALNNSAANSESDQWVQATNNQPFSVGDRIYTRDNSRASVAFTGRNFARLEPNTSLDVLSLSDRRTQLALRDGSAVFDVGYLGDGELFEVATPYGAVDFEQPGLYNVGIDDGQVLVSVLSGLAQVVGLGGSGQIDKGEMLTLLGTTAADVILSQVDERDAGHLVDDYYGYQYPQYYDGRYRDYNTYLNDPNYFDPYRRNVSYQYANSYVPGLDDLDYYGDWREMSGYGYVWAPRVDSGWTPYQSGYWYTDYPYGPTWVSAEPWGYAPYHYGRWAFVGDRWYWVPDRSNVAPVYSPALVSFVPFGENEIGWAPLGPGDAYVPHYYDANWQPYYLTRDDLHHRSANLDVPGAVTVISLDEFTRGFDWKRARKADKHMLASVKPVLDPLLHAPLRKAVVNSERGRGKKDIPLGIAKRIHDTRVITSRDPIEPRFRRDIKKSMRVETVSDRSKEQKLKVRDERGPITPQAERAARPARQQAEGQRVAAPEQQRRQVMPQQRPQARRDPGVVRSAQPAPQPKRERPPQVQQKRERPPEVQLRRERGPRERPAKAQQPSNREGKGRSKKP